MSLKTGHGKVGETWDPYVWAKSAPRLRTAGGVELSEQVTLRINDRVAEVFAPRDVERRAWLNVQARLGPDPDEDTSEDPTALRWPCECCHQREGLMPGTSRFKVDRPARICRECRDAGYRSTRCDCGKPLHHRDYASNSKGGRAMGTKCGVCRAKLRAEFGLESARGA
jgi:hypothetical protein